MDKNKYSVRCLGGVVTIDIDLSTLIGEFYPSEIATALADDDARLEEILSHLEDRHMLDFLGAERCLDYALEQLDDGDFTPSPEQAERLTGPDNVTVNRRDLERLVTLTRTLADRIADLESEIHHAVRAADDAVAAADTVSDTCL